MSNTLRSKTIRLASSFPQGSKERSKLLAALKEASAKRKALNHIVQAEKAFLNLVGADAERKAQMHLRRMLGHLEDAAVAVDEAFESGEMDEDTFRVGNDPFGLFLGLKQYQDWMDEILRLYFKAGSPEAFLSHRAGTRTIKDHIDHGLDEARRALK